jgi:hypothetical protein
MVRHLSGSYLVLLPSSRAALLPTMQIGAYVLSTLLLSIFEDDLEVQRLNDIYGIKTGDGTKEHLTRVLIRATIGTLHLVLSMERSAVRNPQIPSKPNNRNISMQATTTLILLLASLFVILSGQYDPNSQYWAFATVGTILGFWLKGRR